MQAASWAMDTFGKIQIRILEPEKTKMDYQTKECALQVDSNSQSWFQEFVIRPILLEGIRKRITIALR